MIHTRRLVFALAAAAVFAATGPASADDQVKLTIGQRGNWDTATSHLGTKAGIFKKYGLELELLYTSGSGETLQPVIAGSVDLGLAVGTHGAMAAFYEGRAGADHRRRGDRRRRLLVRQRPPRRSRR